MDQELIHQRREGYVHELHQTEKIYVSILDLIEKFCLTPLRKNTKQSSFSFLGMKKPPCTEREKLWLFCNIEEIIQIHKELLGSLEERLAIWGPTQILSDVILAWFPKLQRAYHIYLENYSTTVTTYERLGRYPPFKKFADAAEKNLEKGTSILDLLKAPVTCIVRYAKLISALADNTTSMHPDYPGLSQCKQRVQSLLEELKPRIVDARNVDHVYEIHTSMTEQPFGIRAERRLYLQGDFHQLNKSGSSEDRAYFLFSDMLVFAKSKSPSYIYKGHIQLERAKVRLLPKEEASGERYCIEVVSPFQGVDSLNTTFMASPTAHIMKTTSESEQLRWKYYLDSIVNKLDQMAMHKMNGSKLTPPSSMKRPSTSLSNDSARSIGS
ncbi:Dbl homology domain-containing protein [Sporodiniella umbellata]|nr:Dbl homology domain-containing protein [Sporodiniella umbellata]